MEGNKWVQKVDRDRKSYKRKKIGAKSSNEKEKDGDNRERETETSELILKLQKSSF